MLHDVVIKTIVNVKVCGVEAESHVEAIKKAKADLNFHDILDNHRPKTWLGVEYVEWGEEHSEFLVDEAGDEDYERSAWYDPSTLEPLKR